jgi:hypothetical protein
MFIFYSVQGEGRHFRWTPNVAVSVLVGVAIYANLWAFHRVAEIRRDLVFQEQLRDGLEQLSVATEAIAAQRAEKQP